MSIKTAQAQAVAVMSALVDLKAVYDYPISDLGRKLPALVIVYDSFEQERFSKAEHDQRWAYELTLYLPADGKTAKEPWDDMLDLVPAILARFRADPTLGGTCRDSLVQAGQAVIDASRPDGPWRHIGHTFRLVAQEDTA